MSRPLEIVHYSAHQFAQKQSTLTKMKHIKLFQQPSSIRTPLRNLQLGVLEHIVEVPLQEIIYN